MEKLYHAVNAFPVNGNVLSIEPYGEGHINETYLVTTTARRYILQKMNTSIFQNPDGLMENIVSVTEFLKAKGIETLTVIRTKDGKSFLKNEACYRLYDFIEDTVTYQTCPDGDMFRRVGQAFGEFQNQLADYDAKKLCETIPQFHDTKKRFCDFLAAYEANVCNRAKDCMDEIAFVLAHESTYGKVVDALASGELPLRVTHNDTKLNNILMDKDSGNARAVIDLDTVMPGSLLYDYGDSIRFGASTAAEDETDLSLVHFDIALFRAYSEGYVAAVRDSITAKERELLPFGAYLMTIECGMRFLGDYLAGDTYFKAKYAEHNLVRARTQIRLAKEMEEQFPAMAKVIDEIMA